MAIDGEKLMGVVIDGEKLMEGSIGIGEKLMGVVIDGEKLMQVAIGEKLMEAAIDVGDEEVLEWFHDYINEEHKACEENEVSSDCFAVYCKIGASIDGASADDWLDIYPLQGYIDDIIKEEVNGSKWYPSFRRPTGYYPYKDSHDLRNKGGRGFEGYGWKVGARLWVAFFVKD